MKKQIYCILLLHILAALTASSCLIIDGSYNERKLTEFGFSKEANPQLRRAYQGWIDQENRVIHAILPDYADLGSLVPDFDFKGVEVIVAGMRQTSGSSSQDFSRPLVYSVRGMDDSLTEYLVEVEVVEASTRKEIILEMVDDAGLRWFPATRVPLTVDETISIPYTYDLDISRVRLRLLCYGISAAIGGTTYRLANDGFRYSMYEPNGDWIQTEFLDASVPVEIQVTAEDLSTTTYRLSLVRKPLLRTFSFLKAHNPGLLSDRAGRIDEPSGTVTIEVPDYLDRSALVASFEIAGTELRVNGEHQESGATVNDYQGELVYVVKGEQAIDAPYTIRLIEVPANSAKILKSIRIGMVQVSYGSSYYWVESTDRLVYQFSRYSPVSLTALYVLPSIEGISIAVSEGGRERRDLKTVADGENLFSSNYVDFTQPVTFTVTAEDGSTKEYFAEITKAP